MSTAKDELHHAAREVHHAARAVADHLFGGDARRHLRQAARHALQAGLAHLDACEREKQADREDPMKRDDAVKATPAT